MTHFFTVKYSVLLKHMHIQHTQMVLMYLLSKLPYTSHLRMSMVPRYWPGCPIFILTKTILFTFLHLLGS